MTGTFFFGIDDSLATLEALERFGRLFRETPVHLHLFYAQPESSLFDPGAILPITGKTFEWSGVLENQVRNVMDAATARLTAMSYESTRVHTESRIRSANIAGDILDAYDNAEYLAIALGRRRSSGVKRFIMGSTCMMVYQYADKQPVWVIGSFPMDSPRVLIALDESDNAGRIAAHLAETLALVPEARFTLFHVMPAKPPQFWDDGHILNDAERVERRAIVDGWRKEYLNGRMAQVFADAEKLLTGAGIEPQRIATKIQPMIRGIARDILAETREQGFNILVLGRRGTSAIREFNLGSRASKILSSAPDCTLILVS
jgi:nucleotide-binding universal stress UspA family protein